MALDPRFVQLLRPQIEEVRRRQSQNANPSNMASLNPAFRALFTQRQFTHPSQFPVNHQGGIVRGRPGLGSRSTQGLSIPQPTDRGFMAPRAPITTTTGGGNPHNPGFGQLLMSFLRSPQGRQQMIGAGAGLMGGAPLGQSLLGMFSGLRGR